MKKLITLALAAAFVASSYAPASAVEVQMDGRYQFQFQSASVGFKGDNIDAAAQRLRVGMTFTANENLSGYFQMQAGTSQWGDGPSGGAFNVESGSAFDVRQAYIDWTVPSTDIKVRMGIHSISLPAFVTLSPVMDDLIKGGITVDVPVCDNFGLTGFWNRPYDTNHNMAEDAQLNVFGLVGKASFDGLTVAPWFVYANKDKGAAGDSFQGNMLPFYDEDGNVIADATADAYLFGFGSEWRPFDPFTIALDGAYGMVKYGDRDAGVTRNQEGWYAAAKASYALDFGTPAVIGWFASGDNKGDQKYSGQLPAIYGDFNATNMFFDNAFGPLGGNRCTVGGTWGVGLQLNGVSFVEGLSHDFNVTYIGGTNSKYNASYGSPYDYMTTEDGAVEFGFLTTYKIYKNLTAALDLSYIVEDYDTSAGRGSFENDWSAALCFEFRF